MGSGRILLNFVQRVLASAGYWVTIAKDAGTALLAKPFTIDQLLSAVEQAAKSSLSENGEP